MGGFIVEIINEDEPSSLSQDNSLKYLYLVLKRLYWCVSLSFYNGFRKRIRVDNCTSSCLIKIFI